MSDAIRERFASRLKLVTASHIAQKHYAKPYFQSQERLSSSIQHAFPLKLYKIGDATREKVFARRLADLERGRLYLPYPFQFNDPFDADPYVNATELEEAMIHGITPEGLEATNEILTSFMSAEVKERYLQAQEMFADRFEESKHAMISDTIQDLQAYIGQFRRRMRIACLTEDVTSTTMWANYGGEGNGIAAAYTFDSADNLTLDIDRETNAPISMFPVVYDGRFPLGELSHVPFGSNAFIPYCTESTHLAFINTAVHKEGGWSYEKEWRIVVITPNGLPDKLYVKLRASELYLGEKLDGQDLARALALGSKLGIPVFRLYADHSSPSAKLSFKRIK